MITIVFITSFILDGIFSNLLLPNSIFLPLFTIMALCINYPYFKGNDKQFLKIAALLGFIYDIVYMDTIFLNLFIFLLIAFCIVFISFFMANNFLNTLLLGLISIIIFRTCNYLIYILAGNLKFNLSLYFSSIYNSLISNFIFLGIMFLITTYFSKKYKILKTK